MGLILDSSVLIDAEHRRIDLREHLDRCGSDPVAVSAVTASELLHGVHRARTPSQRTTRHRFVEGVLTEIPIAAFGLDEARTHARLWAEMAARGGSIGAHDLLIAATALTLGFRLATSNVRDFSRVPDLTVEDWTA